MLEKIYNNIGREVPEHLKIDDTVELDEILAELRRRMKPRRLYQLMKEEIENESLETTQNIDTNKEAADMVENEIYVLL